MKAAFADTFRSFRRYNYRLWAAGALISNIGSGMQGTAQDWLVYAILTNHDASRMGVVMGLQLAPQLLLLPWTGLAADRFNQRKLLVATQAAQGLSAIGLGVITVLGLVQLWHVYVFAFLFGCAAAFDAPVRQTFVAELVGDEDLHNAVALNSTSFNGGRLIGPAVAGVLIGAIGPGWSFLANGASFFAVLASLALIRASELRPSARSARGGGSFREGLRYVAGRPDLQAILAMLFLIGTFAFNFPIFISTMAVRVFHADAAGFGLLSSIMAIGTMGGGLFGARSAKVRFGVLTLTTAVIGLGFVLGALSFDYWMYAAALVLIGAATLVFTNATNSLMQLSTPPAYRGRVMAMRVGVALGCTPIGAPLVGFVADHAGPRWALCVGAAAGAAAALVGVYSARRSLGLVGAHGENGVRAKEQPTPSS